MTKIIFGQKLRMDISLTFMKKSSQLTPLFSQLTVQKLIFLHFFDFKNYSKGTSGFVSKKIFGQKLPMVISLTFMKKSPQLTPLFSQLTVQKLIFLT